MTDRSLSRRWLVETGAAVSAAVLAMLTAAWPDWIELVLGVDPDRHSGRAEWIVVAALAGISATSALLAGRAWRRPLPAP